MNRISSCELFAKGTYTALQNAIERGDITATDTVWRGPDGSVAVGTFPDVDSEVEYADFTDSGTVREWLDEMDADAAADEPVLMTFAQAAREWDMNDSTMRYAAFIWGEHDQCHTPDFPYWNCPQCEQAGWIRN